MVVVSWCDDRIERRRFKCLYMFFIESQPSYALKQDNIVDAAQGKIALDMTQGRNSHAVALWRMTHG